MIGIWSWFIGSRIGKYLAVAGVAVLALLYARRSGRKDAERDQERVNLEEYQDVAQRADDAARIADDDTRPVDDRLREHGAFRD